MSRTAQVLAAVCRITEQYLRDRSDVLDAVFAESKQLGGVYIKFLQQLASSEYAAKRLSSLAEVYDKVATEPLDAQQALVTELGPKASEFTLLNDNEPIATGSFAQIYLASHTEHGKVIIKILRPSVIRNLSTDLRLLKLFSYLLQPFLSNNNLVNLPKLTNEFIKATRSETNYHEETRLANYLRHYYQERQATVYVPETFAVYTTDHLLVQEYIEGIRLSDIVSQVQAGMDAATYVRTHIQSDLYKQLENFGAELLGALFFANYVMADPHPGNVILMPGNRVGLIDFGLVTPAPERRSVFYNLIQQYRLVYEKKSDFSTFTIATMAFFDYELYSALKTNLEVFGSSMSDIRDAIACHAIPAEVYTDYKFTESRFLSLVLLDINANNQFGLQISERNVVLQKAMHSCTASVRMACSTIEQYNSTMHAALVRAEEEARLRGIRELTPSATMTPDRAREITADWLSQMAESNEVFFKSLAKEFQA